MDFAYSEEQEALREVARKILEDHAAPDRLTQVEQSEEGVDRELWRELSKANLLGASVPEKFGGSGFGFFELCLLLEEVGRVVAPIPVWPTLVLAALPIGEFGSEEQRQRFLPGVVEGDTLLTAALSEPLAAHPLRPATHARREAGGWRLSGNKICVPVAHLAARVLVPARTEGEGLGLFLVDPRSQGVLLEPQSVTSRERQSRLTLENVAVADADLLGAAGDGARLLEWTLQRAVTGLCAMQVGIADRALRMTAQYTSDRKQFDRPIGSFQAVHQRAGDAYIDVEAMRLTMWQAAFRLSRGEPATGEVAVAKVWASEAGHRVAYAAQHLHGGIGADVDYPIHRYYLWARQIELSLGSAAPHLERLGEELARAPSA